MWHVACCRQQRGRANVHRSTAHVSMRRALPHLNLQVENIQSRDLIGAHVPALPAHGLVPAAAEGLPTLARQDDHAHSRVVASVGEAPGHLRDCGPGAE